VDAAPTDATARDRHRTLLQISNALVSNLTREALFRAIAWALRSAVRFERTAVFLHDADRDVLRLLLLESVLPSTYFEVGLEFPVGDTTWGGCSGSSGRCSAATWPGSGSTRPRTGPWPTASAPT
jgi:hypothetical protein